MKNKVIIIFTTLLMFSSVFGLIGLYHPQAPAPEGQSFSPSLASLSETGSVSIAVSYYTGSSTGQESTQTVTFSQTQGAANSITLTLGTSSVSQTEAQWSTSFSGEVYGSISDGVTFAVEVNAGEDSGGDYTAGTFWVNITAPSGTSYNVIDYIINAQWTGSPWIYAIGSAYPPSQSGTWTLTFQSY